MIGLSGLAAAEFHQSRTGVEQTVAVEARHAALEFSKPQTHPRSGERYLLNIRIFDLCAESEAYYAIEGDSSEKFALFDTLAGVYRTKDNSYVRIHTNFPQ